MDTFHKYSHNFLTGLKQCKGQMYLLHLLWHLQKAKKLGISDDDVKGSWQWFYKSRGYYGPQQLFLHGEGVDYPFWTIKI